MKAILGLVVGIAVLLGATFGSNTPTDLLLNYLSIIVIACGAWFFLESTK